MRIQNEELVLDSTDMASGIESDPIWLAHIEHYSIQVVFTGSPNGSFSVQASNDKGSSTNKTEFAEITNWTEVSSENVTTAGSRMLNLENVGYRWARLVWTPSSGSGTVTSARFNVKGV